ncbi:MAG TPA: iron ABC transporter permease [Candidatus Binatia bacterium]
MAHGLKSRLDWGTIILATAAVIVIYLTLIPILMVIYGSFQDGPPGTQAAFTLKNYVEAFGNPRLYRSMLNSLIFALGGGSLAFVLGAFLAWVTERTNTPLKGLIYAAVFTEIMIPGILESVSLVLLYSPKIGLVNIYLMKFFGWRQAPFNIYSMGGMIWGFGVGGFATPFLLMATAFRSMDPALEEAAIMAGSGVLKTIYQITLKLILPATLATWLLLFIRGMETFEEPAILGLPAGITVLATEIYLAAREAPTDYNLAATFAIVYLLIALGGLSIYFRATRFSEKYAVITGKGFRPYAIDLGRWRYLTLALSLSIMTVVLILPVLVILYASFLPWYAPPSAKMFNVMTLDNYRWLATYDVILRALKNNLVVGVGSATLAVFFTSVVAWIVIRTRIPGRKILDALVFSPIAYPGIVFGLSLMWLYLTIPIPVYGTLWILLIAYVSKYMPICMRACSVSLTQVHQELEDASQISGASWWYTFTRVLVPLILPGLVVGWVYVLTLTFKVLSLPVLLGHAGTEVMPVLIFDLYEAGQYTRLNALGVVVVILVTVLSLIARQVSRRFGLEDIR